MLRHRRFFKRHGAGIRQNTGDGADGRRLRRNQIDAGAQSLRAAVEIAVESAQRNSIGAGRLTHADAGSAGVFQHPGAGGDQHCHVAVLRQHPGHLPAAAGDGQRHVFADGMPAQNIGHCHDVRDAAVRAAADADLIHFHARDCRHVLDMVRLIRTGHQRLQIAKIDDDDLVILRVRFSSQRLPVLLTALLLQKLKGFLVTGKQ